MPHEVSSEDLSAFLDGELDQEARGRVERHLASCADCAVLLERLKNASSAFKKHGLEPAPAGFLVRVIEAVRRKVRDRPSSPNTVEYVLMLAVVVAIVLAGGMFMKRFMPVAFQQVQEMIGKAAGSLGR